MVCQIPSLYVKLFFIVYDSKSLYIYVSMTVSAVLRCFGGGQGGWVGDGDASPSPSTGGWEGTHQRHSGPASGHGRGIRTWYASAKLELEQRVPETGSQKLSWFWGPAKNVVHTM